MNGLVVYVAHKRGLTISERWKWATEKWAAARKKPAESAVHSHVLSFFVSIFGF